MSADSLAKRLKAATPPYPWGAWGVTVDLDDPDSDGPVFALGGEFVKPILVIGNVSDDGHDGEGDADLIAHAPADLAAALEVVRHARTHYEVARTLRPGALTPTEVKMGRALDA